MNTHATLIKVTRAQSRPARIWVPSSRKSTVSISAPRTVVAPLSRKATWTTALSRDNTTTPRKSANDARTGVGGNGPESIITARHRTRSSRGGIQWPRRHTPLTLVRGRGPLRADSTAPRRPVSRAPRPRRRPANRSEGYRPATPWPAPRRTPPSASPPRCAPSSAADKPAPRAAGTSRRAAATPAPATDNRSSRRAPGASGRYSAPTGAPEGPRWRHRAPGTAARRPAAAETPRAAQPVGPIVRRTVTESGADQAGRPEP